MWFLVSKEEGYYGKLIIGIGTDSRLAAALLFCLKIILGTTWTSPKLIKAEWFWSGNKELELSSFWSMTPPTLWTTGTNENNLLWLLTAEGITRLAEEVWLGFSLGPVYSEICSLIFSWYNRAKLEYLKLLSFKFSRELSVSGSFLWALISELQIRTAVVSSQVFASQVFRLLSKSAFTIHWSSSLWLSSSNTSVLRFDISFISFHINPNSIVFETQNYIVINNFWCYCNF